MLRPVIKLLFVAQAKELASNGRDPGLIPAGEDPLEKGMATHSSTWKSSWTEDPGGLQSMGSPRVGTQLSDLTHKASIIKTVVVLVYRKWNSINNCKWKQ